MKKSQLANQECANYVGGKCMAINIHNNLSLSINLENENKDCWVDKEECEYFETIVMAKRGLKRD